MTVLTTSFITLNPSFRIVWAHLYITVSTYLCFFSINKIIILKPQKWTTISKFSYPFLHTIWNIKYPLICAHASAFISVPFPLKWKRSHIGLQLNLRDDWMRTFWHRETEALFPQSTGLRLRFSSFNPVTFIVPRSINL